MGSSGVLQILSNGLRLTGTSRILQESLVMSALDWPLTE
jgi:hypothetical protein